MDSDVLEQLERRMGRRHAQQRLRIESDNEKRLSNGGLSFFRREKWYLDPAVIRNALKITGLYWRARKNAERVEIHENIVRSANLPEIFEGFAILHISDMHVDMNPGAMRHLTELVRRLTYDVCVLTGDFRGKTFGPFDATLDGLARVRRHLTGPAYGVLGNHDSMLMVPGLEAMGIRMLLNECAPLARGAQSIHLAGIDDAHYYRLDDIDKAAAAIPEGAFSILLSHTPEVYREAAQAGFDLVLSGHTHGGQICLPGSIALTLDAVLPRHMGRGAWEYRGLAGYTSVGVGSSIVPVRLNCPPAITLHRLRRV